MGKIYTSMGLILLIFLLCGCSNSMSGLKDAVSGIHSQAEKAKSGLTMDAYALRESTIEYHNKTFTVEDLFKTILRDVQWEYEKKEERHTLLVKGTWKEPLFEPLQLSIEKKEELSKSGKIFIRLTFENDQLIPNETTVKMNLKDETLVDEKGENILYYFYDLYLKEKNRK